MNWYKKAYLRDKIYNDEDMFFDLDSIIEEELEGEDMDPYEKLHTKEMLLEELSLFPPGYTLRKTELGWSVISPEGDVVSLNEHKLIHSILGGKCRFEFMGVTV